MNPNQRHANKSLGFAALTPTYGLGKLGRLFFISFFGGTHMGAYKEPSKFRIGRKLSPCIAIAAILTILPGFARAALFDASVGANIATNGILGSWATQSSGPYITGLSGYNDRTASVWTDYGVNRAGAYIAGSYGIYNGGYVIASSRWIDKLTVYTPNAAPDAWVNLRFSVRLDGHLEAYEDNYYYSGASVNYGMTLNYEGSWVTRPQYSLAIGPTPESTNGGHVASDVDEILFGEIAIQNGHTFNLISELSVDDRVQYSGPPGVGWAESLFGNTAQWLGGSVWIGGAPAPSFTITSGSGFDYRNAAVVPIPAAAWLFGSGLMGLIGVARRKRAGKGV